jgi:hypothetical protein
MTGIFNNWSVKMVICKLCSKPIENHHGNQKFHHECMREGHNKRCREYSHKKLPRKTPIEKTCPYCGNSYLTVRDDTVSCKNDKCKNAYRRVLAKKKWDALSEDERSAFRKKRYLSSPMAKGQYKSVQAVDILCKCPGCGSWHIKRFEYGYERKPGSTPLFNCVNFPGCVSENIGTVIYEVYAGGNECRI